jgi:hypothetical protein
MAVISPSSTGAGIKAFIDVFDEERLFSTGWEMMGIPSGKRLHNYGKSPSLIGKSTINGPFPIAMLNYQRVTLSVLMQPENVQQ